mmetsp:Transcript_36975/g.54098  ORF Transcript_36975/g.54098 Transcript_36975/m.54098 type:complete len:350 (+) Transcript_36975:61-1110(+)
MRAFAPATLLLLFPNGRANSLLLRSTPSSIRKLVQTGASSTFVTPGFRHYQIVPLSQSGSVLQKRCVPNSQSLIRNMTILKNQGSSTNEMELEVEQKFALPNTSSVNDIERKLASLGFELVGQKAEFTDWYFDLPPPHWSLTLRDCWFRYREVKIGNVSNWGWRGSWQLKRGRQVAQEKNSGGGVTVYEEIEGQDAIDTALSMLPKDVIDVTECKFDEQYDGFDIPHLPEKCGLIPFARFETRRTCWAILNFDSPAVDSDFVGLTVDLDGTNFGYAVGEVETIVYSEDKIASAKERVSKLVSKLSSDDESENVGGGAPVPTAGKLETYMIEHRRDHYDACIKAGVMGSS